MRHELYIDNQKVDLSPNTNINLTYKSNLLSELDKITSSYSYTIKLPKTKRNMELIEGCNIPSNDSSFAYLQHRARLLRDGIEIVRDAVVALLSVGSDIQISLTWGNASVLSDFLTNDCTLKDLDFGSIVWNKSWNKTTPNADYGNGMKFFQPVVKNSDIMNKIFEKYNIYYEKPSNSLFDSLVVPCLSAIGIVGEITAKKINLSLTGKEHNNYGTYVFFYVEPTDNDYFDLKKFDLDDTTTDPNKLDYSGFNIKDKNLSVRIKGKIITGEGFITSEGNTPSEDKRKILKVAGLSEEIRIPYEQAEFDRASWSWRYTFNIDFTIKGSDIVEEYIELYLSSSYSSGLWQTPLSINVDVIPVDNTEGEVSPELGDVNYNLSINMPDMSLIDYVKGIMAIMGWYAEPMEGNSGMRMLPYSTIIDNKSNALDWSDKIVNRRIEPSDIEFRIGDMAQKNYFRYAEDETVTGNYDSYISVDDRTLEARKDAITLPFAASDIIDGKTTIPLYEYNDKGELQIKSLTPRIGSLNGAALTFSNMNWGKLIRDNWGAYQDIIRRPKIITEQVRLNAIDLKNIDMTIPVYISQYGSYFAILEIKTKNDDICDVQLLKI